jgi:hypothetical protein
VSLDGVVAVGAIHGAAGHLLGGDEGDREHGDSVRIGRHNLQYRFPQPQ